MPYYLNAQTKDTKNNTFATYVFYCNRWDDAVNYIELELRFLCLNLYQITSTMEIKSAYATNSYVCNFRDKENNITENYYVFSDDFKQVQFLIDSQVSKGFQVNLINRTTQTFVDLVNR